LQAVEAAAQSEAAEALEDTFTVQEVLEEELFHSILLLVVVVHLQVTVLLL
jgi:hypothetical protein